MQAFGYALVSMWWVCVRMYIQTHAQVMRFTAKWDSQRPEENCRSFIISFFLADDTLSIWETSGNGRNTGMSSGKFRKSNYTHTFVCVCVCVCAYVCVLCACLLVCACLSCPSTIHTVTHIHTCINMYANIYRPHVHVCGITLWKHHIVKAKRKYNTCSKKASHAGDTYTYICIHTH
jgi:hypothetical protein